MSKAYEVHCVEIQRTSLSTTENIQVSTGPISSSTGWSGTVHHAHLLGSGKSYYFRKFEDIYPFATGDRMVFLCEPDMKTGVFNIISLANLTTGTFRFQTNAGDRHKAKVILALSIAFCLTVIGWFTTPIAIAMYIYKSKKVWPVLDNGNECLKNVLNSKELNRSSIEHALKPHHGASYIGPEII